MICAFDVGEPNIRNPLARLGHSEEVWNILSTQYEQRFGTQAIQSLHSRWLRPVDLIGFPLQNALHMQLLHLIQQITL